MEFKKNKLKINDSVETQMYDLMIELFPICRSITGDGVRKTFDILKNFDVPFRQFDDKNETFAEAPIIRCSADGSIESFRFSNQLMQMIDPTKEGIKDFYDAYHEISSMVHDSKYSSTFRLNSGEVLIVSSLRVLHAREPFVPNGKRHLQDAYFVYDNALNHSII